MLALAGPAKGASVRLADLAEALPANFTAIQLYIAVGLVIANLQLARLSSAQLVRQAESKTGRGRARWTAFTRAVSRLLLDANAGIEPNIMHLSSELIAEAIESELEDEDLAAIRRTSRPRPPHTLLITTHTSCPQVN